MSIKAVSYNMSVWSAKKHLGEVVQKFASEYSFLADRPGDFFKNALEHLGKNIEGVSVVGIQEYEPKTGGLILGMFGANFESHHTSVTVTDPAGKWLYDADLLTIWDAELLGKELRVYDADLPQLRDFAPGTIDGVTLGASDKGRPISIVITDKGFIIMNFHGINRPKYDKDGNETGMNVSGMLKAIIPKHAEYAGILGMDLRKLIILCDSNDREHGINAEAPLIIGGVKFHDGLSAASGMKTCCYNYDSCGIKIMGPKGTMGPAGSELNYAYTGDYVLGANPAEPLKAPASPRDDNDASTASDHMLVIGTLNIPAAGGRRGRNSRSRRSTRRNRNSRNSRQRKQRKQRK